MGPHILETRLVNLLLESLAPSLRDLALAFPFGVLLGALGLTIMGKLRTAGVDVAWTRKGLHFLFFTTAAILMPLSGLATVCAWGAGASLPIFFGLVRGEGHPWYEAVARPSDAPRRTSHVVVPYLMTVAGGLSSTLLFGPAAAQAGFLVAGIGDAVGEPVGRAWGRRRYRVLGFTKRTSTRSLEGSAAVLLGSMLGLLIFLLAQGAPAWGSQALWVVGVGAALATLLEAVSPHSLDNVGMQLFPAWFVWTAGLG